MLRVRFCTLYHCDTILGFFVTEIWLEQFTRTAPKHLTTVVVIQAKLEVLYKVVSIRL